MKNYEIDNEKSILDPWLNILYRKIKPMIIAISVGVIMDKQTIGVWFFFVFKSTKQITGLKFRIKLQD